MALEKSGQAKLSSFRMMDTHIWMIADTMSPRHLPDRVCLDWTRHPLHSRTESESSLIHSGSGRWSSDERSWSRRKEMKITVTIMLMMMMMLFRMKMTVKSRERRGRSQQSSKHGTWRWLSLSYSCNHKYTTVDESCCVADTKTV
jgi:hypothetical protein